MIIFLYQYLIRVLEIINFPILYIMLKRKKQLQRLALGISKQKNSIWFHAASMGEVNALKPLLIKVIREQKERNIILTTMTESGQEIAQNISADLQVCYSPIDLPGVVSSFLFKINPSLIVIMETELWPQMLLQAKRMSIPVLIVNGRLTDKSLANYNKTKFYWKHIFPSLTKVNAQSEEDKIRFQSLGVNSVENTGNLKFAVNLPDYSRKDLRDKWHLKDEDFVVVFGSSRPGEEKLIFDNMSVLRNSIKNIKIIIVPRHINRIQEVSKIGKSQGAVLLSDIGNSENVGTLIIDKMGILTELYALSDLAIIGGSFYDFGGHNPLEAAFYGIPIIIGQYHSSCRQSVNILNNNKAILISDKESLTENVIKLWNNKNIRDDMGNRAKALLTSHANVLERNYQTIITLLQ